MSEPKYQHIVPRCYLRQFTDPNTPSGQEPPVWIFERGSKRGKRRGIGNILAETDFYTLNLKDGGKDYSIEKSLAQIEGDYASVFENTIRAKTPLSRDDHIALCAFVAAMLQRTLKQKEHIENTYDKMISKAESLEQVRGLQPGISQRLREKKEWAHKLSLIETIPEITKILLQMNLAIFCTNRRSVFITSDAPCFLFNYRTQVQGLPPAFGQKNVEVRMPLSPEFAVCFTWANNLRGYLNISEDWVHESNRMVFGYSHKYFIANSSKLKRRWFNRFPLDPIFITRILYGKLKMWRLKRRRRQSYV